ncbi:Aste57867_20746 [Aphanomyces stellatus]|uniref:Aste57867_20746 protein n=1 Tax=Aphanomyces stellatus TaxID=120398 RepID=A0A485LKF1_9STRA|nr:hypothetical protein As57867_020678 [Aphanomyces stellatus]VFT97425.1 Aste57867_20746 [Aphanomyces stellatus]
MAAAFTCLGVGPGGAFAAFRSNGRLVNCLTTVEDQTQDLYCHFFPSQGECNQAASRPNKPFKDFPIDDDYADATKYWTVAQATLRNAPLPTSEPAWTPPPIPSSTRAPPSTTTGPPPPPGSTLGTPRPPTTTASPSETTTISPPPPDTTTLTPSPATTPAPSTTTTDSPPPPLPDDDTLSQFQDATADWNCTRNYFYNLYAAAHKVNHSIVCLTVAESCHYTQTMQECDVWLHAQNGCYVTNTCGDNATVKLKIISSNTKPPVTTTPPSTTAAPSTASSPLTIVLVVGVVVTATLFLVLVWRRRQLLRRAGDAAGDFNLAESSAKAAPVGLKQPRRRHSTTLRRTTIPPSSPGVDFKDNPLDMGPLALWQLDAASVVADAVLCSGATCLVRVGAYHGQSVVVKKLKPTITDRATIQGFVNEIKLLSTLESPYVVTMIGCMWAHPSRVALVMEFMDGGDLRTYLDDTSSTQLCWTSSKRTLAHGIVQGVLYLHSLNIVHRDLDARNVLVNCDLQAKLTDFGHASNLEMDHDDATTSLDPHAAGCVAPEVLHGEAATDASDVFALGMLLWELDSHRTLTDDCRAADWIARRRAAIQFSSACPDAIRDIALACLAPNPADRPSALTVSAAFDPFVV